MAAPLILRIITDARQTLRTNESVIASNTLVGKSALDMGGDIAKSAKAAVVSSVKMEEALKVQAAAYRELATSATLSGAEQAKAAQLAVVSEARLARSQGVAIAGMRGTSAGAKTAERDVGKLTRGALAGSGVFSALGRSLAFASGGFIAVAGTATLLHNSIAEALSYAATQRQVETQLQRSGLMFGDYSDRIDKALSAESRLSGFTRQDLLQSFGYLVRVSGKVGQSLNLDSVAADVARGRHIALSSASLALAKALGGSSTALRRLGIIVPPTAKGMAAIEYVAKKFAGQAEAGATSADHLHASLATANEVIGTALLPTFNRLVTEFSDWITKMEASGRLERDTNKALTLMGDIFHTLEGVIKRVDDVTGGFSHTVGILVGLELSKVFASWFIGLTRLAEAWGLVGGAATKAGIAQTTALGVGEAGALGGLGLGAAGGVAGRVGKYTGTMVPAEAGVAGIGAAAATSTEEVAGLRAGLVGLTTLDIAPIVIPIALLLQDKSIRSGLSKQLHDIQHPSSGGILDFLKSGAENAASVLRHSGLATPAWLNQAAAKSKPTPLPYYATHFAQTSGIPAVFRPGGLIGQAIQGQPLAQGPTGPFGGIQPMTQYWKAFTKSFKQQMSEAQAALTQGTADDVAAARKEISVIRRLIDYGQIHGKALLSALALEAADLSTIWSAEAAAAQKRAAAVAAAKQKIIDDITNAIDPIKLEVALSRAQSLGQKTTPELRALLAAAYQGLAKAIASGNETLVKQAYDQITSLKQQIKDSLVSTGKQFSEPMKLQIALARAQAFGGDTTDVLKQMKAAAIKALRSGKYTGQNLVDLLNEIANINGQLDSSVQSAYGSYRKASVKALTAHLGLTGSQRLELEQRLARRGPGGTTPQSGVGAAGYIIDPRTGRPVNVRPHGSRGLSSATPDFGGPGGTSFRPVFNIKVVVDGRELATSTTVHQQRYRRSNPPSRRGPNAGSPNA